jgi:hypothetical protein
MTGNGTRRSATDCATRAYGAVEATGDVVIESLEARTNCGSGIVTDGSIDLDFGFLIGNTRHGAISAMGDIRLGIQHEISQNKLDGLRCSEGTLQSSSVELKMIGNEGNGILAREVRLFSGEVLIEESGLNGIEVAGLLDARVPLRVNRNGKKRAPLACQEHRVGGIVVTLGNVSVSRVEADGNCGSGIYCEDGSVSIDGTATLNNNTQFGIWCPSDSVELHGSQHTVSMNGKDGIYAFDGPVSIEGSATLHGNGRLQPGECASGSVGAIWTQGELESGELDIQDNCGSGIRAGAVRAGSVRLLMNSQYGIVMLGDSRVELVGAEHEIARNGLDGILAPNAPVHIEGKANIVGNNRSLTPRDCDQDPPSRGGICTGKRITGDDIEARLNCGTGLIADLGVEVTRLNCSSNTQHGLHSRSGGLLATGTGHFFSHNGGDGIVTPSGRVEIRGVLEASSNGRNGISATDVWVEAGEICNNAQLGIDIFGRPGSVRTGAVRLNCGNGLGPVRTLSGAIITPPPGAAVSGVPNPSPGDAPPGQDFPADFYSVSAGASAGGGLADQGIGGGAEPLAIALVIDLPAGMDIETYFNHGPTADQPTPHWYEFLHDGTTGAELLPGRVVLHLVDGLRGDDDLAQDGAISSLGGPARTAAAGDRQLPGDCNQDGLVNISDTICVLGFLFLGNPGRLPCGDGAGEHPGNRALLDWQPDGGINIADAVAGLAFLFLGGPPHALGSGAEPCVGIAGCPASRACP